MLVIINMVLLFERIVHHAGSNNHAADALSHLPLLEPEKSLFGGVGPRSFS